MRTVLRALATAAVVTCGLACGSDEDAGGGGGGAADSVDLDTESRYWVGTKDGWVLVLYTYADDANLLIDVRETQEGPTAAQYTGARTGDAESGYTLRLDCLNPGVPICVELGDPLVLDCTADDAKGQLVCGSVVFDQVEGADLAQD